MGYHCDKLTAYVVSQVLVLKSQLFQKEALNCSGLMYKLCKHFAIFFVGHLESLVQKDWKATDMPLCKETIKDLVERTITLCTKRSADALGSGSNLLGETARVDGGFAKWRSNLRMSLGRKST